MSKKRKIGFDFDKIFANYPPLVPEFLIEYLYKKKNSELSYRFPGKLEQKIRILSHLPIFRSPIKKNVESLKKLSKNSKLELYLVSSRFSFLKQKTEIWSRKNNINKYFLKTYFNFSDMQPHIFKDRIIKRENIEKFIDDDLDLLMYLSQKNPKVEFYWLTKNKRKITNPASNIVKIKDLEEFRQKYL